MTDIISIDNINSASIDAELDVTIALCEYYCKQLDFLNNNGNEQYFQEGEKWDKFKNDLDAPIRGRSTESVIKSILMAIPRMINAVIKKIKQFISKRKNENISNRQIIQLKDMAKVIDELIRNADKRGNVIFGDSNKNSQDTLRILAECRDAKIILNKYVDKRISESDKLKIIDLEDKLKTAFTLKTDNSLRGEYICLLNGYVLFDCPLSQVLEILDNTAVIIEKVRHYFDNINNTSLDVLNELYQKTLADNDKMSNLFLHEKSDTDFITTIDNYIKYNAEIQDKSERMYNSFKEFADSINEMTKDINIRTMSESEHKLTKLSYICTNITSMLIHGYGSIGTIFHSVDSSVIILHSTLKPFINPGIRENVKTSKIRRQYDESIGADGRMSFEGYINKLSKTCDDIANKVIEKGHDIKGGKCEVSIKSNTVIATLKFYIKNPHVSDWLTHETTVRVSLKKFTSDKSTQDKLNEIRNKPYMFDFEPPK